MILPGFDLGQEYGELVAVDRGSDPRVAWKPHCSSTRDWAGRKGGMDFLNRAASALDGRLLVLLLTSMPDELEPCATLSPVHFGCLLLLIRHSPVADWSP